MNGLCDSGMAHRMRLSFGKGTKMVKPDDWPARRRACESHNWQDLDDPDTACAACGVQWRVVRRTGAPCAGGRPAEEV